MAPPSACEGSLITPVDIFVQRKLVLMMKYGQSTSDIVVHRNVLTQQINLKSAKCLNQFVKRNGRQPNCCAECFAVHISKLRFKLFKKMEPYDEVEDALQSMQISPIQVKSMQSFLKINDRHHHPEASS
jgi:hypothetical protein